MTEAGWRKCQNVTALLWWLRDRGTPRKLRLFAVASDRVSLLEHDPSDWQTRYFDSRDRAIDSGDVNEWYTTGAFDDLKARWDSPFEMAGVSLGMVGNFWPEKANLLRDIFGNPFRPVTFAPEWRTDTVRAIASQMYESREFGAMPILADALQDAGCDSPDILAHCRDEGATHVRGCWVVDLVLGKE